MLHFDFSKLSLKKEDDFSQIYQLVDNDIELIHYCYVNGLPSVLPFLKNCDIRQVFVALFNFDESEMFQYILKRLNISVDLCDVMPLIDEYIEAMFK